MYDLDDNFLTEIGIINMPEPARGKLVEGIQQMISDRVGFAVVDQVGDSLSKEIGKINRSPRFAKKWLKAKFPHYAGTQEFAQFRQNVSADEAVATQFYAQNKWFAMNVPNLQTLVDKIKNDVMQELKTVNKK